MKKFLPYIFTLVIVANILAPISVVFTDGNISVNAQNAYATSKGPEKLQVDAKLKVVSNKQSIVVNITANWNDVIRGTKDLNTHEFYEYNLYKDGVKDETTNSRTEFLGSDTTNGQSTHTIKISEFKEGGVVKQISDLPGVDFKVEVFISQQAEPDWKNLINTPQTDGAGYIIASANTGKTPTSEQMKQNEKVGASNSDALPACSMTGGLVGDGTFTGCLDQAFYYLIFKPTSALFALSGMFFDRMFAYSIADSSYRSAFVVEGWGMVRDICNVFFIFILLFVAFSTVLNVHGFKTKEMIINVVIIGLLINFSLFATQVIIDTSNILARVFYNSESLKPKTEVVDSSNPKSDLNEISLSQGLIAAVQPQKIFASSIKINQSDTVKTSEGAQEQSDNMSAGNWFLLILLATAVNVIGIIVFLSVGIFMIARVIGLWVAMVLVPAAFFSYTVPAMQDMDTVGWKKWWPETMKLAFLAPIFMFFVYLILMFLQKAFVGIGGGSILEIIIPFAFIMMFLWKAKDIAKKMSGEIGGAVMKGAALAGGVALGGAALAGRATVGRAASIIGKQDWLNNLAAGKNRDGSERKSNGIGSILAQKAAIIGKKGTNRASVGSFDFRQTGAGNAFSQGMGMDLNKYTGIAGLSTKETAGGYAGAQEKKKEAQEKFAKSLGYDHTKDEELQDDIDNKDDQIIGKKNQNVEKKKIYDNAKSEFDAKTAELAQAKAEHPDSPGKPNQQVIDAMIALEKAKAEHPDVAGKQSQQVTDATIALRKTEAENPTGTVASKEVVAATAAMAAAQKAMADRRKELAIGTEELNGLENELILLQKNKERIKTGREREYHLYNRKQSGQVFKNRLDENGNVVKGGNVYRDKLGNIKRIGHGHKEASQAGKQLMMEFGEGFLKGASVGAVAGIGGAVVFGVANGIRQAAIQYNPNTNVQVGGHGSEKVDRTDHYKPPAGDAAHHDDSHAAPAGDTHAEHH